MAKLGSWHEVTSYSISSLLLKIICSWFTFPREFINYIFSHRSLKLSDLETKMFSKQHFSAFVSFSRNLYRFQEIYISIVLEVPTRTLLHYISCSYNHNNYFFISLTNILQIMTFKKMFLNYFPNSYMKNKTF